MAEVANGTPSPGLTDTPEAQETAIGMVKDTRKDPHSQGSSIATLELYVHLSSLYTLTVFPSLGGSRQHKRNNKNNWDFTPFF